jgi:hypothetical protein
MSEAETECFRRWIPYGGIALEFGCGGSTKFFFESGIYELYSVESDQNYLEKVKRDKFLAHFIRKNKLHLFHADIGPVGDYGMPTTEPTVKWLNYHSAIWSAMDGRKIHFVLVDGRFRVSCALQTILHCDEDVKIFLHDFTNRPHYRPVMKFVDICDTADTAVVLSVKENVNYRKLALELQKMQFVAE